MPDHAGGADTQAAHERRPAEAGVGNVPGDAAVGGLVDRVRRGENRLRIVGQDRGVLDPPLRQAVAHLGEVHRAAVGALVDARVRERPIVRPGAFAEHQAESLAGTPLNSVVSGVQVTPLSVLLYMPAPSMTT